MNNLHPHVSLLREMLTYCRPCGSDTEQEFRARYLLNLPGITIDAYNNLHCIIGDSRTVYSCHTDTVHRKEGRQNVHVSRSGILSVDYFSRDTSSCLGADDTAGVYLLREMILAGRPGHYIFHYGEEVGGLGSGDLARLNPEVLAGITSAIAFDRKGTRDVITHQGYRTSSDKYAQSLADHLNGLDTSFAYRPDPTGMYTDTAEYAGLIPECTNVSVGYEYAHSPNETLDANHVLALRSALLRFSPATLIIDRDPAILESRWTALDDWNDDVWDDIRDTRRYERSRSFPMWDSPDDKYRIADDGSIVYDEDEDGLGFDDEDSSEEDEDGLGDDVDDRDDSLYLDPAFGRIQRNLGMWIDKLKRTSR